MIVTTLAKTQNPLRLGLPVVLIVFAIGIFLAIASHSLHWSNTTLLLVGCAFAAIVGLLAPLLLLLDFDKTNRPPRTTTAIITSVFTIAGGIAIFLAVASKNLHWSQTTLLVVGGGLVGLTSFLGTPIVALLLEGPNSSPDPAS
jgi:small-conductance mechanosensitive channel